MKYPDLEYVVDSMNLIDFIKQRFSLDIEFIKTFWWLYLIIGCVAVFFIVYDRIKKKRRK